MPPTRTLRAALFVTLLVVGATLAACSSSPGTPTATSTATPAGPDATASSTATPAGRTSATAPPAGTGPTGTPTPAGTAATATPTPPAPSTPATPVPAAEPRPVALTPISAREWARPTDSGVYPSAGGGAAGLYVAEQDGVLYEVAGGGAVTSILDLRDRVQRSGNEEGLLSVALDPGFASNRAVWVYYSAGSPRRTVLARFTRSADGPTIDRGSALVVLEVPQPFSNHNGGAIRFGPDGMLYLGLGDGGSGGDPTGNGQNLGTLLGSIIRIDVREATTERPYTVPADNPFVGREGARGEIWAYGLRNPWRMSFDAATGTLWVGDVGQNAVEEIDRATRGGNFGWNVTEGDSCYRPTEGCERTGFVPPVVTYTHGGGRCSIVGGPVYRGTRVPEISGAYIYGDTCSGEVWAISAAPTGQAGQPATPVLIASGVRTLSSFGVDANGEVTLLSFGQPIRRITSPS